MLQAPSSPRVTLRRSVATALAGAMLPVAFLAAPAAGAVVPTASAAAPTAPVAAPGPLAPIGQRAVTEAAKHRGKPYRYGATGPRAFDCSGYTGYVYRQLGVQLPRTSSQQLAATRRIAKSAKRPGDLLFTVRNGRVGHVGIYAGSNKWWVAPKAGDVVKLQTLYTSQYLVGRPR